MLKLEEIDPLAFRLRGLEKERQAKKIILIPSESICPPPVREALASCFTSIYAEGYPSSRMVSCSVHELEDFEHHNAFFRRYYDRRYYKGCDLVDYVESLAKRRCAELFAGNGFSPDDIYVNVQPLSGAPANSAIYTAFLKPGDVLMGPALDCGGHLSHGSCSNRSGMLYNALPYRIDRKGKLDYNELEEIALKHNPRMIVSGFSAYPWGVDWKRLREICDEVGAYLLADIAHPAGLIAAGLFPNPIGFADVTMFTTHKTMLGPRGAVIMTTDFEKAELIDKAVFPGEQGGPHINNVLAKAVCFKMAKSDEFRKTQERIVENCGELAAELKRNGVELAYGGTSTHMLLVDLDATAKNLTGEVTSRILDLCRIVVNKNTLPGDANPVHPTGIRLGTAWVTQMGMNKKDMDELARLISKILYSIRPFFYTGSTYPIGRGKISLEVMERVSRGVEEILRGEERHGPSGPKKTPMFEWHRRRGAKLEEENGYLMPSYYEETQKETRYDRVIFDMGDMGLLKIRGERAFQFLQDVATTDLASLGDGEITRSLTLKSEKVLDDVLILKLSKEEWVITTHPGIVERVRNWLQGLSDGYIIFDKDLLKKVDGPVTIEPMEDYTMISICGKLGDMPKEVMGGKLGDWHHFYVEKERALGLWEDLVRSGVQPAGTLARDRLMEREKGDACQIHKRNPSLFSSSKVYFIGRDSLPKMGRRRKRFEFPLSKEGKLPALYNEHLSLNAHMTTFAGWKMPLSYDLPSKEHRAVRTVSGLFDLSHMGVLQIEGEYADRFLDIVTTNYILPLEAGWARYSYIFSHDGEVIDDVFVYKIAKDEYMLVCNAVNEDRVKAWLRAVNSKRVRIDDDGSREIEIPVEVRDLKAQEEGEDRMVNMALQGPASREALSRIGIDPGLRRNQLKVMEINGFKTIISGTGYTGEEIGYEIYTNPDNAKIIWRGLLEEGGELVKPCGLASRDSTRIEAGLLLYGQELAGKYKITPTEAGYGQFVKFHKPFFIGREKYLTKGVRGGVIRFRIPRKGVRAIRFGDHVLIAGRKAGNVTSCTLVGGMQVGMAFVRKEVGEGSKIGILTHGKVEDAIVLPRFLREAKIR